jgi:hypothetical protein
VTMDQEFLTASPEAVLPLWRLFKQGHDASCEVAKIPAGFEGRCLMDGRFLYSHQFTRSQDVMKWAFAKQVEFRQRGWSRVMTHSPLAGFDTFAACRQSPSTQAGRA